MTSNAPQPFQPLESVNGIKRFRVNKIVEDLLDFSSLHGFGLNEIATKDYSRADRVQLAQLIGYSLSGFGELPYVTDGDFAAAQVDIHERTDARLESFREQVTRLEGILKMIVALAESRADER